MMHPTRPTLALSLALACLSILGFAEDKTESTSVNFPHELHYDDLGFDCEECHHETNAEKLDIPHENYFAEFWARCKTCHEALPDADILRFTDADEWLGTSIRRKPRSVQW